MSNDVYDLPEDYRVSLPQDDGPPEYLNDEAGYYADASLDPLELLIAEEEAELEREEEEEDES